MLEMKWIPMGDVSALSRGVNMLDSFSEYKGWVLSALTIRVSRESAQSTEGPPHKVAQLRVRVYEEAYVSYALLQSVKVLGCS